MTKPVLDEAVPKRWPIEKANAWHSRLPWLIGCNFIPSTAINQLEMWQRETFDPSTIERELGWAERIGFNVVRVYLHDLLWEADPTGFTERIRRYLDIAERHGIRTLFVLFDDCWNDNPKLGRQPEPVPGVHNSGWLRSPGSRAVTDTREWPRLERYVKGVLAAFATDVRVVMWDLYNEPGNRGMKERSYPLVQATFRWAREVNPSQPLTIGIWTTDPKLNDWVLAASDVISFHNYNDAAAMESQIAELKRHGRPLVCTEYLRRPVSRFETHLPILRREQVGAINWGLVAGKTQTIWPWGSPPGAPEPDVWFHDILRPDGTPFDPAELTVIQRLKAAPPPR